MGEKLKYKICCINPDGQDGALVFIAWAEGLDEIIANQLAAGWKKEDIRITVHAVMNGCF